jgi:hypothetical protein
LADPANRGRPRRVAIWLVATGPLGFAIAWSLTGGGEPWQIAAALGGAAAMSLGGALVVSAGRAGGVTMTLGLAALLTALAPAVMTRPLLGLVLLLTVMVCSRGCGVPGSSRS